jgi:nucleotide-binding universal stress UspA family protein
VVRIGAILHPTDFSGNAREAMVYSLALAIEFESPVHIICIVNRAALEGDELLLGTLASSELESIGLRNAQERMEELVDWIRKEAPGVKVTTEVVIGIPFVEIVKSARTRNSGLIVMGTHGRSGLAHLMIGSTAEKVVRHAPCPVLVVPTKGRKVVLP